MVRQSGTILVETQNIFLESHKLRRMTYYLVQEQLDELAQVSHNGSKTEKMATM